MSAVRLSAQAALLDVMELASICETAHQPEALLWHLTERMTWPICKSSLVTINATQQRSGLHSPGEAAEAEFVFDSQPRSSKDKSHCASHIWEHTSSSACIPLVQATSALGLCLKTSKISMMNQQNRAIMALSSGLCLQASCLNSRNRCRWTLSMIRNVTIIMDSCFRAWGASKI